MKNNKVYIILIAILLMFAVCMYLFIGRDSIEKRKQKITIITQDSTIFKLSKGNWSSVKEEAELKSYDWKSFSVYLDNEYKGEYYLYNDNKWLLFDLNKKAVTSTENLLAFEANFNLKVKTFNTLDNNNFYYVSQVLNKYGFSNNEPLTVNTVTNIDIDNDGIDEDIYVISNAFSMDYEPEITFSYVFMIKDNQIYMMYEYSDQNNLDNGLKPYIHSILDADNDGEYEILLTCARYSTQEPINILYKFEDKAFKTLISNQ